MALGSYPAPPGARKRSASAVILRSRTKQSNQGFSAAHGSYPTPPGARKRSASAVILCSRAKQSNQGFSVALGPYPAPSETRKRSGKNLVFPREPAAASPTGMMVISALGRNNTPPMPKIPSWDFRQPSPQRRLWLICSTIGGYTGGRTHPPQSGRSYRPHNRRRPARPPPARRSAYNRWADRRRSPKNAGRAG